MRKEDTKLFYFSFGHITFMSQSCTAYTYKPDKLLPQWDVMPILLTSTPFEPISHRENYFWLGDDELSSNNGHLELIEDVDVFVGG